MLYIIYTHTTQKENFYLSRFQLEELFAITTLRLVSLKAAYKKPEGWK